MSRPIARRTFLQGGVAATLTAASWRRVSGANERIGVGYIGYGLIGKRHLLDFQDRPDAVNLAIAEVHAGRRDEARQMMGPDARSYSDFRDLLNDRRIDAVVISTPDHWHALQTMLACAAGKDVYVEKPLTLFIREGRWMIDVAKQYGRIVTVGTQQRSGPHYARARELLKSGAIGQIHAVKMSAARNIMPGYGRPPDGPAPAELDWEMWQGPTRARAYNPNRAIYHFRWFWDYSGGQMTNLGAHALDIVHWALGVKGPLAVSSAGGRFCLLDNGETPDTQDVLFEYPGFIANWSHREACGSTADVVPLEFFGSRGRLALTRSRLVVVPDKKVNPANTIPQFTDAHPVGGPQPVPENGLREMWTTPLEDKTGNAREQLRLHVRNFLDCVKSRQQPVSDLESSHQVASACHLANLSLKLGRKLRWDAEKELIVDDPEANRSLLRTYRAPWDQELKRLGIGADL